MFGYSFEEAQGRQAMELLEGPYTDRSKLTPLRRCIGEDEGGEQEMLAYDKSGEEVWISASLKVFRNRRGRIKYMFALLTDITESKQLRSLQQLIMTALADEIPITDIADRLCRRVEEIAPDVVCSLLHVDAGGVVHPLGGPSLPEDYCRALDGVTIGPNKGSCGTAAFYGKPVLAMDIDTDPRWQPFKARPLEVGLRACWSTPIKGKDGRVIGTFAFYFRECRAPSRWHQRIVDACVHLGALAIERKEARPDRAARLLRRADRPAEPHAFAGPDLRGDRGLSRRGTPGAGVSRRRQFQGRQRYARALGRRRIAGAVCPAPARADSPR
jgi:PAS domain S-box-containing protein